MQIPTPPRMYGKRVSLTKVVISLIITFVILIISGYCLWRWCPRWLARWLRQKGHRRTYSVSTSSYSRSESTKRGSGGKKKKRHHKRGWNNDDSEKSKIYDLIPMVQGRKKHIWDYFSEQSDSTSSSNTSSTRSSTASSSSESNSLKDFHNSGTYKNNTIIRGRTLKNWVGDFNREIHKLIAKYGKVVALEYFNNLHCFFEEFKRLPKEKKVLPPPPPNNTKGKKNTTVIKRKRVTFRDPIEENRPSATNRKQSDRKKMGIMKKPTTQGPQKKSNNKKHNQNENGTQNDEEAKEGDNDNNDYDQKNGQKSDSEEPENVDFPEIAKENFNKLVGLLGMNERKDDLRKGHHKRKSSRSNVNNQSSTLKSTKE